ncbi:hypothetical protein RZA67_14005 [Stenotrophomonas sp. C3(2023)]|uniref:hypothetical protein n=1 Tax=Stenotrophomonas sp. C3(2023) TaxID=3080277 RepID=UPI00293D06C8|nr:hypothetical protein [Stenotrophomonas sp. C3(2023)]MDV3469834.1 hypothetical protein [Stenotrophomonas sp. C3(2023)]
MNTLSRIATTCFLTLAAAASMAGSAAAAAPQAGAMFNPQQQWACVIVQAYGWERVEIVLSDSHAGALLTAGAKFGKYNVRSCAPKH